LGSKASKTVLATGAFDILHLGHVRFLEESKKAGGRDAKLLVVVASDRTVTRRKGIAPVLPEEQRRRIVSSLKPVDQAILGHEHLGFLWVLREYRPDIVAFGHDQRDIQKAFKKIIKRERLPIKVVRIRRYGRRGFDSSTTVKKLVARSLTRRS